MQFQYVDSAGKTQTIEAADANTAMRSAPNIAPSSGVQQIGFAPSAPQPQNTAQQSPLLSFAQTLDQAVNLARQKRNTSSLDMMQPFQGTLAASDFSSILSNLNRASDSTAQDLTKRALETDKDKLLSVSDARSLGVPYGTTEKDAAAKGIVPKYKGSEETDLSQIEIPTYEEFYKEYLQTPEGQQLAKQYGGDNIGLAKKLREIYATTKDKISNYKPPSFTKTEIKRLEQAGLLEADRQAQLDYLYGEDDEYADLYGE